MWCMPGNLSSNITTLLGLFPTSHDVCIEIAPSRSVGCVKPRRSYDLLHLYHALTSRTASLFRFPCEVWRSEPREQELIITLIAGFHADLRRVMAGVLASRPCSPIRLDTIAAYLYQATSPDASPTPTCNFTNAFCPTLRPPNSPTYLIHLLHPHTSHRLLGLKSLGSSTQPSAHRPRHPNQHPPRHTRTHINTRQTTSTFSPRLLNTGKQLRLKSGRHKMDIPAY
jgi:hypothetical protein